MNMNQIVPVLETLKLKGFVKHLNEIVNYAEKNHLSFLDFLYRMLESELKDRKERRLKRNMSGAHFPVIKRLNDFKPEKVKGISKKRVSQLLDFRWIDNHENILFFGPPGLGKTHLAISFGVEAIEAGYTVCFERITNLIRMLKTMDIQRSSGFRIKRILKSDLVIIDEIGYTPIDKKEANLFFTLISELYEKQSVILTSNKGFDSWAEMLGDTVMTTALLDRLLHHATIFNLDGESYRIRKLKEDKPS
jgi:DNA replication protein DnaC